MSCDALKPYQWRRADPGIGNRAADIGTKAWAEHVRLSLQSVIKDLPKAPQRANGYFNLIRKHEAWRLMNKPDGSFFKTIEEFCAHPEPWGLGREWATIEPFLVAVAGRQAVQLFAVPNADEPVHDELGRFKPLHPKGHNVPTDEAKEKLAKRLRAVDRAPDAVKDLYREGLIGQAAAAKLGPKNPTPDEAAHVAEVAQVVVAEAKAAKPATDAEKAKVQRRVNVRVRELVGDKPDPVAAVLRAFERLTDENKKRARALLCGGCQ